MRTLRRWRTHEKWHSAQQTWQYPGEGCTHLLAFWNLFLGIGEMYINPLPSVWWGPGPASIGEKVEASLTQLTYSVPHLIHSTILWGNNYSHFTDDKTALYSNWSVIAAKLIPPDTSPEVMWVLHNILSSDNKNLQCLHCLHKLSKQFFVLLFMYCFPFLYFSISL